MSDTKIFNQINHHMSWDSRNYISQYEKRSNMNLLSNVSKKTENYTPPSIIIDSGSFESRIGYSIFSEPNLRLKSLVGKSKVHIKGVHMDNYIGEELLKADPGKLNKKSPYEKNLIFHFTTQESLLDYSFKSLNINDDKVNYPVVMTEPYLNISYSRKIMNELMFELYGVPSLCLGVDFMYSAYKNNVINNNTSNSALIISSSNNITQIVPVLNNKPILDYSRRISIGGNNATELLMKALPFKYPLFKNKYTYEVCQNIKEMYSEASVDYVKQCKLLEKVFLNEQERIKLEEIKLLYGSLDIYNKILQKEYLNKKICDTNDQKSHSIYTKLNSKPIIKETLYNEYSFVSNNPILNKSFNEVELLNNNKKSNYDYLTGYQNKYNFENKKLLRNNSNNNELKLNSDYTANINKEKSTIEHAIKVSEESDFIEKDLNFINWPEEFQIPVITEEEIKRRQQHKIEQGKRLKEILTKKREEKQIQIEQELKELNRLLEFKESLEQQQWEEALEKRNITSEEELTSRINELESKLTKDNKETEDKEEEIIDEDKKWPLINIPDEDLDFKQQAQKRMQKLQRNGYYMRLEKKEQARLKKEHIEYLKSSDPENYLVSLFAQKKEILEKLENIKQIRKDLQNRRSKTNLNRMMVLAELENETNNKNNTNTRTKREKSKHVTYKETDTKDKKKGKFNNKNNKNKENDDDFGINDDDWDVYREISKHNLSDDEDEEKTLLDEVEGKILEVYPEYEFKALLSNANTNYNSEYYKNCYLGIDQFRPAELIFKPYLIGNEQAGIIELIQSILKFFTKEEQGNMLKNVFLTGGNMSYNHIEERIYNEIRQIAEADIEVNVIKAYNPSLDAWKGAKRFSEDEACREFFVSKEEYNEKGYEYIKEHCCSNKNSKFSK